MCELAMIFSVILKFQCDCIFYRSVCGILHSVDQVTLFMQCNVINLVINNSNDRIYYHSTKYPASLQFIPNL